MLLRKPNNNILWPPIEMLSKIMIDDPYDIFLLVGMTTNDRLIKKTLNTKQARNMEISE